MAAFVHLLLTSMLMCAYTHAWVCGRELRRKGYDIFRWVQPCTVWAAAWHFLVIHNDAFRYSRNHLLIYHSCRGLMTPTGRGALIIAAFSPLTSTQSYLWRMAFIKKTRLTEPLFWWIWVWLPLCARAEAGGEAKPQRWRRRASNANICFCANIRHRSPVFGF